MFPPLPDVPAEQTAEIAGSLRYEDVAQDGRLTLTSLAHFMGEAVFHTLLRKRPEVRANAHAGILSILTRLTLEGGDGPLSVRRPVQARGGYQMGHTVDDAGRVNRLLLNTWAALSAPVGRTHPPQPDNAGHPIFVGRVFGEHVLTRPFAPPAERKVLALAPGPWPPVPAARLAWTPVERMLELPVGARPLDGGLEPDDGPIVFSGAHTDSNQHVNSLVYPRLFEEALARRLSAHGRAPTFLGRFADTAYRKPCFAGQRMRILLRAYERDGRPGAVGVFVPDDDRGARPHTVILLEG